MLLLFRLLLRLRLESSFLAHRFKAVRFSGGATPTRRRRRDERPEEGDRSERGGGGARVAVDSGRS